MRPGSGFLKSLNSDSARYRGIPWATVRTPLDLTILPSSSTEMAEAKNSKVCVWWHPLMIFDRRVNERVLAFLNGAE